jgi:hypothetical protein
MSDAAPEDEPAPAAERLSRAGVEELLAELRGRQDGAGAPAAEENGEAGARRGRAARKQAGAAPPAGGPLQDVETGAIAEELVFRQRSIYGTDDRRDLYQVADPRVRNDADCVVSLWHQSNIVDAGNNTSRLVTTPFWMAHNLCATEPFYLQSKEPGGRGTGFLVARDVVATAGHCVTQENLATTRFVFGFKMNNGAETALEISNDEIYRGVAIIDRRLDALPPNGSGADWALVRLHKPVTNHRVASVRRLGSVANGQAVHVIGHPAGLPVKVAGNATVLDNTQSAFFAADLDIFGGNSGSPVLNSQTHEVEGIVVRRELDFVPTGLGCNMSYVYFIPGTYTGANVTRSTQFAGRLGLGWQEIDDSAPTTAIAAGGWALYKLHGDGHIYKYGGTPMVGWQLIDNNQRTVAIAADGAELYQLHDNGEIYRYTNTPMTGWQRLGEVSAAKEIMAAGGRLYRRHGDGSIFRRTLTTGWQQLDNNPQTMALAEDGATLYQRHGNGQIYKYTGTPMSGWALLDNNSLTAAIAASGDPTTGASTTAAHRLYQLHKNGQVYQYTNTPMTGWQQIADTSSAVALAADWSGGLHRLYKLHSNGEIYRYTGFPITGWQLLDGFSSLSGTKALAAAGGQLYQRTRRTMASGAVLSAGIKRLVG